MGTFSQERLEEKIVKTVGSLIVGGYITGGVSTLVSVKGAKLATDNTSATVFVSSLLGEEDLRNSVAALNSARGFIQKRLARVLKTKNTPVLHFVADTTTLEAERLNQLIDKANGKP